MKTLKDYNLESLQAYPLNHRIEKCDECGGFGQVQIWNRHELGEFFRHHDINYSEALEMYRNWKFCKIVDCPKCSGEGKWDIYY